ncbi:hypothetical protein M378DRAFT_155678 [Amanita muscaria Koide BX008]|uniref:Endonuclease/exonuclease/phosphatase domain-containing protein n=1 Tax=Amanita muscaria (strain Koide BX008) TaxID=946122 RepID=A0A0C2XME8_AMAMK|nr:hypothetical protein M378DRAFT_155678 [Amanita muscaria Koide BX008]
MIHQELLAQNPDIMCLQEVDRLDKITAMLESSQYSHLYAAGQSKKHGCLIAFKRSKFTKLSHHLVDYDQEEIRADGDTHTRQGRTFRTRNIGLLLALKSTEDDNWGILVVTTHLFWHPKYDYERARQAGILVREIIKYRSSLQISHWPCILAGDFNFTPNDPAYALIVGEPLLDEHRLKISESQVVHISVDPAWQKTSSVATSNDEEEAIDPDRVITNARVATPADGLLSIPELEDLYAQGAQLRSIYDIGLRESRRHSDQFFRTFGDRVSLPLGKCGSYEPEYTSYAHYWKTVLDYIFVLDPVGYQGQVFGLLAPHRSEDLEPGLPKRGVCGSDHISLVAELGWH